MTKWRLILLNILILAGVTLGFQNCGGAGGGSDASAAGADWYYHWNCHGDYECLQTNPTSQATGDSDEGPVKSSCTELLTFAAHFWGSAATNSCDQSPTAGGGGGTGKTLTSLTVTPSNITLAIGLTQQYRATAYFSDGSTQDVTAQATWIPGNGLIIIGATPVATLNAAGVATAVSVGNIAITARYSSLSASTTLFVSAVALESITVTPANPSIEQGLTQQFTATGHFSDGTTQTLNTVTWTSATTSVATIDSKGLATAIAPISSVIQATSGAISGSTTLTVTLPTLQSITVTPADPSVLKNSTVQFTATGAYSNGTAADLTAQVAWSSAIPTVATIDGGGFATTLNTGPSLITASLSGVSGSTTLTVTAPTLLSITVTPGNPSVAPGTGVQFYATGNFSDGSSHPLQSGVTWTSGTLSVATITPSGGASASSVGASTITATSSGISGSTVLNVVSNPPGISWTAQTVTPVYNSVVWSGTQFVAVGSVIVTSPDGLTWTTQTNPFAGTNSSLVSVTWSGTQFVAVGTQRISYAGPGGAGGVRTSGIIITSPDGVTWTSRTSGIANFLHAVTWAGNQFVVVGSIGTIITSSDGVTWTPRSSGTKNSLSAVTWSGSRLITVGDLGTVLTSQDGVNWVSRPFGSVSLLNGVTWSGAQFVAVGVAGAVFTSANGVTWAIQVPATAQSLNGVIWTGTQFVSVGGAGTVLTSNDGVAQVARTSGTTNNLFGSAWSGSRLVIVGSGSILTSP